MTKANSQPFTSHQSSDSDSADLGNVIRQLPQIQPTHGFDRRVVQAMLHARSPSSQPARRLDQLPGVPGWLGDFVLGRQGESRLAGQQTMVVGRLSLSLALLVVGLLVYWVYGTYFAVSEIDPSDVDLIMMMGYHLY